MMKDLFRRSPARKLQRPPAAAAAAVGTHIGLVRTFVETGNERCPLAGIWSRLPESAVLPDEPESTRPVLAWLRLPGRALNLSFNLL